MKTLVLNGSPRDRSSNTFKITKTFLEEMENANYDIDIIDISKKEINHCIGCFHCWNKTPGICLFKDDMKDILELYKNADIIIWSFPLYYFGMPSKIKALLDRLLPLNLPFMYLSEDKKTTYHTPRYNLPEKKYILISTCGFPTTKNNYEALKNQFDILYPKGYTNIFCPEGGIINIPQLNESVKKYLEKVKKAGKEFVKNGYLSEKTKVSLEKLIIPKEEYIKFANLSWDSNASKTLIFMRQMASVYEPKSKKTKKDIIIEFEFTDINENYQLILKEDKCIVIEKDFLPYSTKIITPFSVWEDISSGKINGAKALLDRSYKIKGSFKNLLNMYKFFPVENVPS